MSVITASRIQDPATGHQVDDGAVVVLDGLIAWWGPAAQLPEEHLELPVTALGDATVMPGLVDAHVHLAFDGSDDPVARMLAEDDARQVALMLHSARQLLSTGVTTARDLGARGYLDLAVRDAIAAGDARGPRMLTAGSPITVTGGHCWYMGGEADTEDEVRKIVRRHHKHGVDLIKVMSTGGFMTRGSAPWFAQFVTPQLAAIVDEAHRVGLRVAAHAHGVEGIARAVEAGVDTLEHCSFVRTDGSREFDRELAQRIVDQGIYVSPTASHLGPLVADLLGDGPPPYVEINAMGGKVIASTDAGINNNPHSGLVHGLVGMEGSGMPTADVLVSATSLAAEGLGLAGVTGRLQVGLAADLIAVGGDPRQGVAALHDLRLVMTAGTLFTPDPVAAMPGLSEEQKQMILSTKPKELLGRHVDTAVAAELLETEQQVLVAATNGRGA